MDNRGLRRIRIQAEKFTFVTTLAVLSAACGAKQGSGFDNNGPGGSGSQSAQSGASASSGFAASGGFVGQTGNNMFVITTSGTAGGGNDAGPDAMAPPDPNGCPSNMRTTVSGVVYDPSLQDPLYNITVFAPKSATLPAFTKGIGANSCSCDALYPPFYGSAVTDATGHFVLSNVPVGTATPIVVQTGKWRKEFMISVPNKCADNPVPDKTLRLPKNGSGDGDLPDIAISTGQSDSMECLLLRIGVDATEWTAGGGGTGHIHIFNGNGANMVGTAATSTPAPASYQNLWNSAASLEAYDVTLLSCEGHETQDGAGPLVAADQQALLDYAGAGGRVFASHYHYAWFNTGPWLPLNLATWYTGQNSLNDGISFPGDVYTTLLNGAPFPEGVALQQWLGVVNALTNMQLPIYYTRHNSDVLPPPMSAGPPGTPSQPWIILDPSVTNMVPNGVPTANAAQYFSVDTPVGSAQKCGRVVYSDLHVSGGGGAKEMGIPYFMPDYPQFTKTTPGGTVPGQCAMHALTPQEKALEFMIFDLSSCLIPIGQPARPPRPPA